jgi:transposase
MSSTRNGVSGKEIQRQLGVTYKCAWRMGHQIRLLMAGGGMSMLFGVVEVDQTYVGGKNANKHKKQREILNKKGTGAVNKTPVLTLLQRNCKIINKVLDKAEGKTIKPVILANVQKGIILVTDGFGAYSGLNGAYGHEIVNHEQEEFVRGKFHTKAVEGYFSQLKRTIGGTHIHVSKRHLEKYANECSFRYTHRDGGQMMFHTILSQVVTT